MNEIKILTLVGSLRKDSYNRAVFETVKEIGPKSMIFEEYKIGNLPLFNQDMENDLPEAAKDLKQKIVNCDAVLFITPEYNYSIPGVLKNAIDWGSRPHGNNSWKGKPAAIMSASIGIFGGARCQYHLRQAMVDLDVLILNKPEIMVGKAMDKIENGKVVDEETKNRIGEQLNMFEKWIKKING